jgi:hypothetical protein
MRQAPLWSIPPTSGGVGLDRGYAIAVDGSGNAYVTGWTSSTDYDVTPGAFQTTNEGGADVFVTKVCHPTIITLTSAPGTDNQTVCVDTAIDAYHIQHHRCDGSDIFGLTDRRNRHFLRR